MVHMFWPIVMARNKNELSNTKLTTVTSVIMIIIMGTLNAQTVLALSAYRFFKHTKYINNKASVHTLRLRHTDTDTHTHEHRHAHRSGLSDQRERF